MTAKTTDTVLVADEGAARIIRSIMLLFAMLLSGGNVGIPREPLLAVLLLAPHVIGAPEPEVFTGPVPTELGALFAARAFGVGMAAWALVGCFAGHFWSSQTATESVPRTA